MALSGGRVCVLATACGTLPESRNIMPETSTLGAEDFCPYGTLSHANIPYATENHLNGLYFPRGTVIVAMTRRRVQVRWRVVRRGSNGLSQPHRHDITTMSGNRWVLTVLTSSGADIKISKTVPSAHKLEETAEVQPCYNIDYELLSISLRKYQPSRCCPRPRIGQIRASHGERSSTSACRVRGALA